MHVQMRIEGEDEIRRYFSKVTVCDSMFFYVVKWIQYSIGERGAPGHLYLCLARPPSLPFCRCLSGKICEAETAPKNVRGGEREHHRIQSPSHPRCLTLGSGKNLCLPAQHPLLPSSLFLVPCSNATAPAMTNCPLLTGWHFALNNDCTLCLPSRVRTTALLVLDQRREGRGVKSRGARPCIIWPLQHGSALQQRVHYKEQEDI